MRLARVRTFDEEMLAVPDEFSIVVKGNEEETTVHYEEHFFTSAERHSEIGKKQAEKLKIRFPDDEFESTYEDGISVMRATFKGTRDVCLSRILNEILFQAKCYFSEDSIDELVRDTQVKDTFIWREN